MYRVGPLARINIAERFGTPIADQGLADFRERYGRIASSAFLYHHARVLEVIACAERIAALMDDPVLLDTRVRAQAGINANRGVGASEAPRGTLIHDYEVDDNGLITAMNLIIATGQNDLAMNATILSIAKEFVDGPQLTDGMLNRIEAGCPGLRPVPVLLDPRDRADADEGPAAGTRRRAAAGGASRLTRPAEPAPVLVIGVGSLLRTDDAVGRESSPTGSRR
jgi:hypothetical protein